MNRLVQLSVNTPSPSSDLKVRIYYPVSILAGPDLQVCRTYTEYLSNYGEDSFAQLLFSWNYELLCHRVSYVYSKANLTKYLVDGNYEYYQDTGHYLMNPSYVEPNSRHVTHKNSLLVTINPNMDNYNDFYIIMKSKMIDGDNIYSYSVGLFGCDYIKSQSSSGSYNEGKEYIKSHFDLEPLSRSMFLSEYEITEEGYIDKRLDLNSFDLVLNDYFTNCSLMVEPLGYHRYLVSSVSEDISYSLFSDIVSVEELEDYYDRYHASIYKDHRILSISSKWVQAQDSIKVAIEELDTKSYSVHVTKSSGNWIDEEYFTVDPYAIKSNDTVRSFEEINLLSKYVYFEEFIDYFSDEFSPVGVYDLKNSFGFNNEDLFINKLAMLNEEIVDGYYFDSNFYTDLNHNYIIEPSIGTIYLDLLTQLSYSWDGVRYLEVDYSEVDIPQPDSALVSVYNSQVIEKLGKAFPQALIITAPGNAVNNGIRVNPATIYWFNYESEIPSGLAILELLKTTSYYNDATQFRLPESYPIIPENQYDIGIVESDYGMEINSIYVNRFSKDLKYSIRAFIARAMVYRICLDISGFTMSNIRAYIETMCSKVGNYLNMNMTYELKNESKVGRTYKADLMLIVDNKVFTRFEIYTELNYEE